MLMKHYKQLTFLCSILKWNQLLTASLIQEWEKMNAKDLPTEGFQQNASW